MVEFGLHQDKFVAAAEVGQLAAEQPHPRQRVRMAGERARHRIVKPRQRRAVRREVDLALLDARAQQGERFKQPARAGILGELAKEWLSVDHALDQRFELSGVEVEQPFLFQERRRVGTPNAEEMLAVAG